MNAGKGVQVEEKKEEEKVVEERRNVKERLGKRDNYVAAEVIDEPRKCMSAKAQRFLNQERYGQRAAGRDDNEDGNEEEDE